MNTTSDNATRLGLKPPHCDCWLGKRSRPVRIAYHYLWIAVGMFFFIVCVVDARVYGHSGSWWVALFYLIVMFVMGVHEERDLNRMTAYRNFRRYINDQSK